MKAYPEGKRSQQLRFFHRSHQRMVQSFQLLCHNACDNASMQALESRHFVFLG